MATTSQKFRSFQSEPIGEKEVTSVAGIGDVLGARLVEKGYDKVSGNEELACWPIEEFDTQTMNQLVCAWATLLCVFGKL